MQPIFRQVPPRNSRSTHAVLKPSCAARIAAMYPPGPAPITIRSKFDSATIVSNSRQLLLGGEGYGGKGRWSTELPRPVYSEYGIVMLTEVVMTIRLKPELAKFVDKQVKSGQFKSADDAVNAAVARAQIEEELLGSEISEEDWAAIEEGLAQLERGEGIPWEKARAQIEKKYLS